MSPLSLRRHRAERLLREEFDGLRGRVLASVRGRLRASGVSVDEADLEACYAQAWQGLYAAVLDGQEIANPSGWLVLVTYRRAIDDHRARARARCADELSLDGTGARRGLVGAVGGGMETQTPGAPGRDFAAELDDRVRLRQLFEGLRGRLDAREREAATLCYLQGLSRAEAAERMGVSERRMRKLMEGHGPGRPGVAGKVGALVQTIRDGGWCAEQGSLMRALAYGILDPDGERHRLALAHHGQCPACRAYVASLRGLAATLPPAALPWGLVVAGAASELARSSTAGVAGAAGASGAAGGGWLFGAGPLGAKLAVGCLLALSVGAGCVALETGHARDPRHGRGHASRAGASARGATAGQLGDLAGVGQPLSAVAPGGTASATPLTPSAKASREFGPEQALAAGGAGASAPVTDRASVARSGSAHGDASEPTVDQPAPQSSAGDSAAAEREFSPG